MAIVEVKVPQLSESVAEATLLQWKKKPGEAVAMDEILIEIETDKVVLEVPAPADGVLAELVKDDGDSVISERVDRDDRHRRQERSPERCSQRRRRAGAGGSRRRPQRRRARRQQGWRRDARRRQADGRSRPGGGLGRTAPARTAA